MLCEICPGLLCAAWDLVPEWGTKELMAPAYFGA